MQNVELMQSFLAWCRAHDPTVTQHRLAGLLTMSDAAMSQALRDGRGPRTVQGYLDRLHQLGWPAARVEVIAKVVDAAGDGGL